MSPVAGWYPDPEGASRIRYWDGGAWTDQYRPVQTTSDVTASASSVTRRAGLLRGPRLALLVGGGALALGALFVAGPLGSDDGGGSSVDQEDLASYGHSAEIGRIIREAGLGCDDYADHLGSSRGVSSSGRCDDGDVVIEVYDVSGTVPDEITLSREIKAEACRGEGNHVDYLIDVGYIWGENWVIRQYRLDEDAELDPAAVAEELEGAAGVLSCDGDTLVDTEA